MVEQAISIDEIDGIDRGAICLILLSDPVGLSKLYTRQVGGYACNHPKANGYILELPDTEEASGILSDHFTGELYGGWCCDGIMDETEKFVNDLINGIPSLKGYKVDTVKKKECQEGWIYLIHETGEKAILTFENSD